MGEVASDCTALKHFQAVVFLHSVHYPLRIPAGMNVQTYKDGYLSERPMLAEILLPSLLAGPKIYRPDCIGYTELFADDGGLLGYNLT